MLESVSICALPPQTIAKTETAWLGYGLVGYGLKKYMTDKHGMESKQAARRAAPKDGVLYRVGVCIGVAV